ncbi:prolipoprotein diacylglyceryl transferase [Frondihabitans australicus]|uniref:Phosphatidylglycerol--prolipoprotein diacylglyceryl transferase n=1 Tax=Frondihabitans australicus TaxID=386892 RepID=A0A495IK84_9MICO|nr:prolipoprotein diacylglyceryl transferase [Frondihabitans australicus]RKR76373.1 prolipoprotein diacylglyceryl transferase [Frondihabitans australicus]
MLDSMFHGGIPSPPVNHFDLGPLEIHYYAICIVVGIAIACWVTNGRMVKRGLGSGTIIDIAIWAVPIGIVGGRFYHVVTHPGDYFAAGDNLLNVFAIWEGGLAIFGSILCGTLGAYIGCRRAKVPFALFADAVIPGLLLAQAFGRLGNYFNQELYGGPTTLPWGLQISPDNAAYPAGVPAGTLFQPLFLYEMLWNILGAVLILTVGRRLALKLGQTAGFYFLWYGAARAFLEYLRLDPTEFYLFGLKINEDVAIAAAIFGLIVIIVSGRRGHPAIPESPPAAVAATEADTDSEAGVSAV